MVLHGDHDVGRLDHHPHTLAHAQAQLPADLADINTAPVLELFLANHDPSLRADPRPRPRRTPTFYARPMTASHDDHPTPPPEEATLTLGDLAVRTGLTLDQLEEVRSASGLEPGDAQIGIYVDADVEAFTLLKLAAEMFSWDEAVSFVRVVGASISRIADAANSMYIDAVERPMVAAGVSEEDLLTQLAESRSLADQLDSVLRMMLRLHLDQSIDRHRRATEGSATGGTLLPMAVGFIDLVGFTSRSLHLSGEELAELVERFEAIATEVIGSHRGRLVKLIGDEVMFVAATAEEGCAIAESLLERFGAEDELTPRGGLDFGPVLARVGDFFGPVVNRASRLEQEAIPGEVLMTPEAAAGSDRPLDPAGRRLLKGFDEPVTALSLTLPES